MVSNAAICIVWRSRSRDQALLIHRPVDLSHPLSDKWFFPGGVIEDGEAPGDAARREVAEETHVLAGDLALLDTYVYTEAWEQSGFRRSRDVRLHVFEGYWESGAAAPTPEATEVAWIEKNHLLERIGSDASRSHLSMRIRGMLSSSSD